MESLGTMLSRLTNALVSADTTLTVLALVLGVAFVGHGLLALIRHSKTGSHLGIGLGELFLGFLLVGLPSFINAFSLTLFEEEASLSRELGKIAAPQEISPYLTFAIAVVVLVGIASVIRGFVYLRNASSGRDEYTWLGLTHIVAGILCINTIPLAQLLGNTCGGIVQSILSLLFV